MKAFLEHAGEGSTVVTVNRRLARGLRAAYAERSVASGLAAWETPDVLPFPAFINRSWRNYRSATDTPVPALLSEAQERLIWETVIRTDAAADPGSGFSIGVAARQAQSAFALLNAWQIDLDTPEFARNEDTRAFRTWARAYSQRCADGRWIDAGRAASALVEGKNFFLDQNPARVVFAGFEILTLQQRAIIEALMALGIEVFAPEPPLNFGKAARYAFDDLDAELRAVAAWCRQVISEDPVASVGVVVPDLHLMRDKVERLFDDELRPGHGLPGSKETPRPFNLSMGAALSRVTVVGDALLALELGRERFALEAAGRLLRSPYLRGAGHAAGERARLDLRLRDIGEADMSLRTLSVRAAQTELHTTLANLLQLEKATAPRQPLSHWSVFFSDWLRCFGWPGDRGLTSEEFQAVEAFRALLDEVARCGVVAAAQTFDQALALLHRFADEQVFQPESAPAPIQIVGALEAAGLEFSKLWICGLTDNAWPPPADINPFLPPALQRAAGMPQAAPDTTLALAQKRLAGWLSSADEIIVSHARFEGDEALRQSPLIVSLAAGAGADLEGLASGGFSALLSNLAPSMETIPDHLGSAFPASGSLPAGAAVLADQAACPFRAFAHHRLMARGVTTAVSSLDPKVRGILVHRALFDLWSGIRSLSQLQSLPANELEQRIEEAVDRAIARERRVRPDTLRGALAQIERQRLVLLVRGWVEIERARPPFEVIAHEQGIDVSIGGLDFTVRPDRVDRLGDGGYLLVDYKTGSVNPNHWFGPRPEDPQLAIYTGAFESAVPGSQVVGAAYGVLRRHASGLRGFGSSSDIAEGIHTLDASRSAEAKACGDWDGLKREWRETLQALAEGFAEGDARVSPKNPKQTCRYCDVMPLCRIFESVIDPLDLEEDEA